MLRAGQCEQPAPVVSDKLADPLKLITPEDRWVHVTQDHQVELEHRVARRGKFAYEGLFRLFGRLGPGEQYAQIHAVVAQHRVLEEPVLPPRRLLDVQNLDLLVRDAHHEAAVVVLLDDLVRLDGYFGAVREFPRPLRRERHRDGQLCLLLVQIDLSPRQLLGTREQHDRHAPPLVAPVPQTHQHRHRIAFEEQLIDQHLLELDVPRVGIADDHGIQPYAHVPPLLTRSQRARPEGVDPVREQHEPG